MCEFNPTREVNTCFWKNSREFGMTFEEKYLYLYALTNDSSCKPTFINDVGYVISYKFSVDKASRETGLSKETITKVLRRMTKEEDFIYFDENTSEIELFPL